MTLYAEAWSHLPAAVALAVAGAPEVDSVGGAAPRSARSAGAGDATSTATGAASGQGLRQTETWSVLSDVNGARCQSAQRDSSSSPASRAMRSSSDGQA
jgi:hypothetical protein